MRAVVFGLDVSIEMEGLFSANEEEEEQEEEELGDCHWGGLSATGTGTGNEECRFLSRTARNK